MILPKHMPALDGLRGVAILMVVLTHCGEGWFHALSVVQDTSSMTSSGFTLPVWVSRVADAGVNGVPLFFVVSAFTLTTRANAVKQDWGGYAVRRIARVGPAYWIAAIVYTAMSGLRPLRFAPEGISLTDVMVAATFGTVWKGGSAFAVVPGGWSVSAEVAFYLFLPFVLMTVGRRLWRAAALCVLTVVVAQIAARHAIATGEYDFFFYATPLQQIPVFLCGVTAAIAVATLDVPRLPGLTIASLSLCIVAIPVVTGQAPPFQFALLATLAVATAAAHPPRWLCHPVIVWLGKISYSIFLVHHAVLLFSLLFARRIFPAMDWHTLLLHFTIAMVVSAAVASLTWRFIEQPPIRWAARISRRLQLTAGVANVR